MDIDMYMDKDMDVDLDMDMGMDVDLDMDKDMDIKNCQSPGGYMTAITAGFWSRKNFFRI